MFSETSSTGCLSLVFHLMNTTGLRLTIDRSSLARALALRPAPHPDPARLPEPLVPVAHAHDQRVDAAQHGIHAIEALDAGFRAQALGTLDFQPLGLLEVVEREREIAREP